jgi:hypothetical protein
MLLNGKVGRKKETEINNFWRRREGLKELLALSWKVNEWEKATEHEQGCSAKGGL